ncbi:MAG: PilZ domain-containing protein [Sedimentisphaerales bacterium]|nr:PilZ domain-containing protein [Sedimentisphaerales bacterium]
MNLPKIENILNRCDISELIKIEKIVQKLIENQKSASELSDEEQGSQLRREQRFQTNILGTLVRITDIKPGERKEYSVTLKDISQSGMCLIVDLNFVPSRIVEVVFAGPGGKIKRSYLEVVRMRKMTNQDGSWLEVGCRAVGDEEVRHARLQEDQIAKMRSKMHKRSGIIILAVGPETEENSKLIERVKAASYQIRQITGIVQAMESARKISAQLAILCNGSEISKDPKLLAELSKAPSTLARMAIVDNDEDRFALIEAGVDECLKKRDSEKDDFLFYGIERAMVSHLLRQGKSLNSTTKALVVSMDNTKINLITYQLEDHGYKCKNIDTAEEALQLENNQFAIILADYDIDNNDEIKKLVAYFTGSPVIAMCDEIGYGHRAMTTGVANYLNMPPNKDDVRMILESCVNSKQPV